MKEESKYYQPKIEEFCVGFEYHHASFIGQELTKYVVDDTYNFKALKEEIINEIVRVKYLDSQDIIDCGFIQVANDPVRQKWINALSFEANDCRIELFPYIEHIPEQLCGIVNVFTPLNYGGCLKFHGKIKNKQELQTILRQIGVL